MRYRIANANDQARFLTLDQVCSRYNLGRSAAKKAAENAGARIKISKRICRYDSAKIDSYLESLSARADA